MYKHFKKERGGTRMLQKGQKVMYGSQEGEVMSIMDHMVFVKLEDGKEYSLPLESVKAIKLNAPAPTEMTGVMMALKPHIKSMAFLNDFATMMGEHGVSELYIKAGKIAKFEAKESLEERIARVKAEASAAAEKKAREDYAREHHLQMQ